MTGLVIRLLHEMNYFHFLSMFYGCDKIRLMVHIV